MGNHLQRESFSTFQQNISEVFPRMLYLWTIMPPRESWKAILSRKNSYFYKTAKGAHVGDLHMSLIHTAELVGANPFDYLTQLQKHAREIKSHPSQWMPWNYRETIDRDEIGKTSPD